MAASVRQALREWTRLCATAVGAAFLVGAGQLGVLYGLDIVRWDRTFEAGGENGWSAQLTWVAWCVIVSTVAGAGAAMRLARRLRRPSGWTSRVTLALVAGVGGGASAFLAVLPATAAHPPTNVDPDLVVMITAGAAAPAGVVLAVGALTWTTFAGNIITTAVWVWLFAAGSIIWPLVADDPWPLARLGVPEPFVRPGDPLVWINLALVVVVSIVLAMIARFGGSGKIAVAVSGLGGPAIIAIAYLIAGPGVSGDHSDQLVPYRSALLAALASVVASLVVAAAGRRPPKKRRPPSRTPVPTNENDYVGWVSGLGPGQHGPAVPQQAARPTTPENTDAYPGGAPDPVEDTTPDVLAPPTPPADAPTEGRRSRGGRQPRTSKGKKAAEPPSAPPLLGMPPAGGEQATFAPPRNVPPPVPAQKRSKHAKPEPPPAPALPTLPAAHRRDPDEPITNILAPGHP